MENSKLQEQVINLGKLFVKELNLDPGVDTLSRWMAHYIAEKMTLAEHSSKEEKQLAEKECFDTILKLWEHRWNLPGGKRPFEGYDSLLETIKKIATDNEVSYPYVEIYMKNSPLHEPDIKPTSNGSPDWISIAKQIDKTARILVNHALSEAAKTLKKEATEEWLEASESLPGDNDDIDALRIVIDLSDLDDELEIEKETRSVNKYKIRSLKNKITDLKTFKSIYDQIFEQYSKELLDLENS